MFSLGSRIHKSFFERFDLGGLTLSTLLGLFLRCRRRLKIQETLTYLNVVLFLLQSIIYGFLRNWFSFLCRLFFAMIINGQIVEFRHF